MGFGERLIQAGDDHGRLCVGIDPHSSLLLKLGLSDDLAGLREFSRVCVEAFAGHVALIKPQVAFFERFGSAGYAVLEEVLEALRGSSSLVVADAKRGDIGSTMVGYAQAWLSPGSPLEADAVTLTPYLGVGSLAPAIDLARTAGKGVFVMAANSNPEAEKFQSQLVGGVSIAQQMVDECAELNRAEHAASAGSAATAGSADRVGSVGVVVGATVTHPPVLEALNAPVLVPGVGAQGASFADVDRIAGSNGRLVFPSVSRAVFDHGLNVSDLRKQVLGMARR